MTRNNVLTAPFLQFEGYCKLSLFPKPGSPWLSFLPQLSGGCELTVVIHDFMASNSNELTVRRGQTVEVLERCHDRPDWCLVRTTDRSPALEGLVPCSMLCIAHSRSSMEMEGIFNHKGTECVVNGQFDGGCSAFKELYLFRSSRHHKAFFFFFFKL